MKWMLGILLSSIIITNKIVIRNGASLSSILDFVDDNHQSQASLFESGKRGDMKKHYIEKYKLQEYTLPPTSDDIWIQVIKVKTCIR